MDERMIAYLDKALALEERGGSEEAILLCGKILEAFPECAEFILTEKAKLEFRNRKEKEALQDFIRAYSIHHNDEIYDLILEAYVLPKQEELWRQYQKNASLLQPYSFYKNDFDTDALDVYVLWMEQSCVYAVNMSEKKFFSVPRLEHPEQDRQEMPFMMINCLWQEDIFYYKEKTKTDQPFMDKENPFFLVYDRNYWMLFAQEANIEALISDKVKRMVLLIGEHSFLEYFNHKTAFFPKMSVNGGNSFSYEDLLKSVGQKKIQEAEACKQANEDYYQHHDLDVVRNIRSGRPRILFWTSRFTTALKYHTRDCMQAARRMGCETELLIEPDGIHRITELAYQSCIREFRPDMVFNIDHFRFEYEDIPKELVWTIWVQDPLHLIMDRKTPAKLLPKDLVMIHCISWKEFDAVGYAQECLIDAPIPANHFIYHPYELSAEEWQQYACDICLICHASDMQSHMEGILKRVPQRAWEMVYAVYQGYQSYVYETGNVFYDKETLIQYVQGAMFQHFGIIITEEILNTMVDDIWMNFNQRVYRQALADWLIDAGYTNLKLWGEGWQENEKYKAYAMGPAQNGETLSKICQASKIVLGNNVMTTAAARAWETMLSGGFYLSNYIPPEQDAVDIRKIMDLETEVAVFYNREDLLRKVDYYLNHEEERQRMIAIGRKAALERMTYDVMMERVIAEAGERLAAAD